MSLIDASVFFDSMTGELTGQNTTKTVRKLADLQGVFEDDDALKKMDPNTVVYEVEMHQAVNGTEGGLYFGTSYLHPGKVGKEYFLTKGHFHEKRDRAEYYWGISGEGLLLLMDEERKVKAEKVSVGSLHYIPGHVAHRLVNIGDEILTVGACWPSDAGHDYETIKDEGFSGRIKDLNGKASLETC